ncbi:hypothetical protein MPNT_690004 [Candidatus Methylacidithermus pantelleriae]|uniref:Uncharacterized protein n=1 Tax=Candidatus Methylacidithermus pantelleriae TaxID=2744239 RepID=A0A8J2FXA9_9BACT|nr:hypothetical protein MPNT_690004 [Candidatus Methylacidithermus pantelleriae]
MSELPVVPYQKRLAVMPKLGRCSTPMRCSRGGRSGTSLPKCRLAFLRKKLKRSFLTRFYSTAREFHVLRVQAGAKEAAIKRVAREKGAASHLAD